MIKVTGALKALGQFKLTTGIPDAPIGLIH